MRIALSTFSLLATRFLVAGSPMHVEDGNPDSSNITPQATRIARSNQGIELSSHPQTDTTDPADPTPQHQCTYHRRTEPGSGLYNDLQRFLVVGFSIEFRQGPHAMDGIGEGNQACEYIFHTYNALQIDTHSDRLNAPPGPTTCYVEPTGYSTLLVTAVRWEFPDLRVWKVEQTLQTVLGVVEVVCEIESPGERIESATVVGDGDPARGIGASFAGVGDGRGGDGHESTDEDGCLKKVTGFMGTAKELCRMIDPSSCADLFVGLSCV